MQRPNGKREHGSSEKVESVWQGAIGCWGIDEKQAGAPVRGFDLCPVSGRKPLKSSIKGVTSNLHFERALWRPCGEWFRRGLKFAWW